MGAKSGIEWTDATWNPVRAMRKQGDVASGVRDGAAKKDGWHCEHVSEGCRNCYAESINRRLGTGLDFKPGNLDKLDIFLDEKLLTDPLRWKRPRSVFLSSMTDVFADFVSDEMLDRMFAVMALGALAAQRREDLSPLLRRFAANFYRVLTKRGERMTAYIHALLAGERDVGTRAMEIALDFGACEISASRIRDAVSALVLGKPLPNVGLGVSVEDQASADERIPHLLATPAAMRFVSCEPLLGPVDLRRVTHRDPKQFSWLAYDPTLDALTGNYPLLDGGPRGPHPRRLHEVIVGGESGTHARPMHPDWARSLRDQCASADVAFFFKQWGEWLPYGQHLPGFGVVTGCRAVKPGLMKIRYGDGPHEWPLIAASCIKLGAMPDGHEVFRVGKKAAGAMLDGREHREIAPQVTAHFEKLAPHPKNPETGFSTSPQGGGEGIAEGEAS